METFLPVEDVEELTGYKRKAQQCAQLRHMGIRFHVNRLGRPVVVRETLVSGDGSSPSRVEAMPDLEAVRELENGAKETR